MQKAKKIYRAIFIIRSGDGRYLIHKRSDSGLLAGLWEFPGIDFDTPFDDTQAISALHSTIGVVDTSIVRIGAAKHAFSHIHWHMTLYHVKLEKKVKAAKGIWATKQEIGERAFPSALRAALDWINE